MVVGTLTNFVGKNPGINSFLPSVYVTVTTALLPSIFCGFALPRL